MFASSATALNNREARLWSRYLISAVQMTDLWMVKPTAETCASM